MLEFKPYAEKGDLPDSVTGLIAPYPSPVVTQEQIQMAIFRADDITPVIDDLKFAKYAQQHLPPANLLWIYNKDHMTTEVTFASRDGQHLYTTNAEGGGAYTPMLSALGLVYGDKLLSLSPQLAINVSQIEPVGCNYVERTENVLRIDFPNRTTWVLHCRDEDAAVYLQNEIVAAVRQPASLVPTIPHVLDGSVMENWRVTTARIERRTFPRVSTTVCG